MDTLYISAHLIASPNVSPFLPVSRSCNLSSLMFNLTAASSLVSREILLRFRHVRRSCLDSVRQCQEIVPLSKVLQQSVSGCLRLIHGVHYCHLLRCRLSLLFSWQSPCSIPAIMVFLHLQDVSLPEGVCYSLCRHHVPLSLIS